MRNELSNYSDVKRMAARYSKEELVSMVSVTLYWALNDFNELPATVKEKMAGRYIPDHNFLNLLTNGFQSIESQLRKFTKIELVNAHDDFHSVYQQLKAGKHISEITNEIGDRNEAIIAYEYGLSICKLYKEMYEAKEDSTDDDEFVELETWHEDKEEEPFENLVEEAPMVEEEEHMTESQLMGHGWSWADKEVFSYENDWYNYLSPADPNLKLKIKYAEGFMPLKKKSILEALSAAIARKSWPTMAGEEFKAKMIEIAKRFNGYLKKDLAMELAKMSAECYLEERAKSNLSI